MAVLTVSDEVVERLWTSRSTSVEADLILAAGDLPFDYLEYLMDSLDAPCVFVPGNHDAGQLPGPAGATNADGRIVAVAGLRIAGLGGSIRYNDGPNQWTERQQARRAAALVRRHRWYPSTRGRAVDVFLAHSPALGVGDGDDGPHRGFACFHSVVRALAPRVFVHGHVHPYGRTPVDHHLDGTLVINTVGYAALELTPGASSPVITGRRHGA